MKVNQLLLLSKNDIPFESARLIVHQPSIKQIAYIGQRSFFSGCEYLSFSKNKLKQQDKVRLKDVSDFEILMMILRDQNPIVQSVKENMLLLLTLMFPQYKIQVLPQSFLFVGQDKEQHFLDKDTFDEFKSIMIDMYCLQQIFGDSVDFNPTGPKAQQIARKIEQGKRKRAKLKGQKEDETSIFGRYISILAVGEHKDINELFNYSVFQLINQFKRFQLKQNYDVYISAKMAGATGMDEADNWTGDLYTRKDDNDLHGSLSIS